MHASSKFALRAAFAVVLLAAAPAITAGGNDAAATKRVPPALAVDRKLAAPSAGVSELKFEDVFKLPAGPKGLEPTAKLLALDGKRVRIVGYMVRQETPAVDGFLLAPLPVQLGDEDESLADDLPPSTLRIELAKPRGSAIPALPGLLQFSGVLHVGMRTDAASGRATPAQLVLDAKPERALVRLARLAKNANVSTRARAASRKAR